MGDIQKEKMNNYLKWLRPSPLNTIFSLKKKKEDVGGSGLGLKKGRRQCPWRYKNKYLVNEFLLGHEEAWEIGILTDFSSFLHIYTT